MFATTKYSNANTKDGPYKSDMVDAVELNQCRWKAAINERPPQDLNTKMGATRGIRYHLAQEGGSA